MARWYFFQAHLTAKPFQQQIARVNRQLRKLDYDALAFQPDGRFFGSLSYPQAFDLESWRNPLLNEKDICRILVRYGINVYYVKKWECKCSSWGNGREYDGGFELGIDCCRFITSGEECSAADYSYADRYSWQYFDRSTSVNSHQKPRFRSSQINQIITQQKLRSR